MKPVVNFLRQQGLTDKQVVTVLVEHPPVLSYDPETHLAPLMEYLKSVGIESPAEVRMFNIYLLRMCALRTARCIWMPCRPTLPWQLCALSRVLIHPLLLLQPRCRRRVKF
jgi:hypothetical protein